MEINKKLGPETCETMHCRCCLQIIDFTRISSNYYDSSQNKLYEEMIKSTFGDQIYNSLVPDIYVICHHCALRIKDAAEFKHMVTQNTDKILQEILKKDKIINDVNVLKCESSPVLEHSLDGDEFLCNFNKDISYKDAILDSSENINEKNALKETDIDVDHKDWEKITERRGFGPILRENSLKLIANSTVCVFQWNKSRYRCFCCKEPFSDVKLLREHTKTHSIKSIEKIIILQQNRLVKVEVSIIDCKLCGTTIDNLSNLRKHLNVEHDFTFKSKEDLLMPFKIDKDLSCQLCNEQFRVFRFLNIHMNKHFQKQVCHICGAGFSNLVFLNLHKSRTHKPIKCRICNMNFITKGQKKTHEINTHNIKYEKKLRFPCAYCDERFFHEHLRVKHLIEKHDLKKPEFKCGICSKSFLTQSLCNNHYKTVHLKEKKHECDVCHNFFYTKSDVARHKITHTGEKKYLCSMCNKPYASKDSLRRHVKKSHGYIK